MSTFAFASTGDPPDTARDASDAIPREPLTPFDVPGGPPIGLALGIPLVVDVGGDVVTISLDQGHVEQAYLQFVAHYQGDEHKPTRDRARKSRDALLKRAWRVVSHADASYSPGAADDTLGSVLLLPGSGPNTYAVDDQDCRVVGRRAAKGGPVYCPDSLFATVRKTHRAAGELYPVACYHTIAREILRLAVALAARDARARAAALPAATRAARRPTDALDTDCALSTIAAPDLWAACFLVQRAGGTVTIRITSGDLALSCGRRRVVLAGTGDGACAVTVDAETFASLLLAPLKARVTELGPVEVIIDLSGDEPAVAFSGVGTDFGAVAPARRLSH